MLKTQVQNRVHTFEHVSSRVASQTARAASQFSDLLTSHRLLIAAWVFVGLLPFTLLVRSYVKFALPHKPNEILVAPSGVAKDTGNLLEHCPLEGFVLGQVWWNVQITHSYQLQHGWLCHYVVPQYNIHGNFFIGSQQAAPFDTSPLECTEDSYPIDMYLYHGSFGYFSFYEGQTGTYCATDKTAYVAAQGLGTFDMNGKDLTEDGGSHEFRKSYWYCTIGAIWVVYRGLVLRRSFILCKRYGRRCTLMGVKLRRKEAVVFVHEQLRLTAFNATKWHRVFLLYLLIEGLMGDLFLLISNNGFLSKIQYVSLGYNLSGLLLVAFEIVESTNWLPERTRVFIKRLLFCYESSLLGEIVGAILQQPFLTWLNGSKALKTSNHVNLAVSHYVWSIAGHCFFVFSVIGFIMSVRALWALVYVQWKHHTWSIFSASCGVDTALGRRNKMTMLGGYHWEDGQLSYKPAALKSFGLLKEEQEDGETFLALRKLHWIAVPRNDLVAIGVVSDDHVQPCSERPSTGVIGFFGRSLGGCVNEGESSRRRLVKSKVVPGPPPINIFPTN